MRRNSFRRINDAEYLDITLGRVCNVTRENRNGADHIVTEFAAGTLIMSEEEMRAWATTLSTLGLVILGGHQRHQASLASAELIESYWPTGDLGDDPDGDNT